MHARQRKTKMDMKRAKMERKKSPPRDLPRDPQVFSGFHQQILDLT